MTWGVRITHVHGTHVLKFLVTRAVPWPCPGRCAQAARGGAEVVAAARERESALLASIAELRGALSEREAAAADREEALRRATGRLEERCRQLEVGRARVWRAGAGG